VALGFNLNFSLDSSRGGLNLSRQTWPTPGPSMPESSATSTTMAAAIWANARKGRFDHNRRRLAERGTDARGEVLIPGLANYVPVTVGIDTSSLPDPMLAPRKALQVVVPRPGIAAEVDIALVGAGDIEGAVVRDGGDGFEGLDVELIDASGTVVGTTGPISTAFSCSNASPTAAMAFACPRNRPGSPRSARRSMLLPRSTAILQSPGSAPSGRPGQQIAQADMVRESSHATWR
jgi:hypothetical protein